MRLAIISGKGGTGKTTVAVNLALYLQKEGQKVCLADCDVEEPNAHFFLDAAWSRENRQTVAVPEIDNTKCLGESCLQCVNECRFNSLIWMADRVMVFSELCHACGLCFFLCPVQAVDESTREIGLVRHGKGRGVEVCGGLLRIGEAMAPPLIRRVLKSTPGQGIVIADAPPGTSCPVMETLRDVDYVILVGEPTPFGLHDFKIAVELVRKLGLALGTVINRDGMGDDQMEKYIRHERLPLLARLPYSRQAAAACSRAEPLLEAMPEFKEIYRNMWENLQKEMQAGGK